MTETSTSTEMDQMLEDLRRGAKLLVTMPASDRQRLLRACVAGVEKQCDQWARVAWDAKRLPAGDPSRAEDILSGPVPTVRYLQLLDQTFDDIAKKRFPQLPQAVNESNGRLHVPVFPTKNLFDRLLFGPIKAHVRMQSDVRKDELFGNSVGRATGSGTAESTVTLVLGAGNVSSIPITDTLTKIFQESHAVVLKMNPVNEYVGPIFEKAFASLIQANLLRVVYGGHEVGAKLIAADGVDSVHITGSDRTHDAIVWGSSSAERNERKSADAPRLTKPITSELGNVSPWIIVPGKYSTRQLRFQAENIVASVTSNASFVCIATKMLITCKDWPQRDEFLTMVNDILARTPRRYAYYPGAADRFEQFAGSPADDPEHLPWTFRRDLDRERDAHLFNDESFVCVFGETSLQSGSSLEFLNQAVDFANDQMWGTLSAALTCPQAFRTQHQRELNRAVDRLRFGIVGINQWPGVAFALMSTPWGAFPGSSIQDVRSGIGNVHNTYLLDRPEKTVIESPLAFHPKPVWFSTHRRPESVARSLLKLYLRPSVTRIPPVLFGALSG